MSIINNKLNRTAIIRLTANATVNLADLAVSNVASNTITSPITETVVGATITRIYWSGNTTIARGSNVVFQAPSGTSDHWDLSSAGIVLSEYPGASLVFTVDAAGMVICEVTKQSNPMISSNAAYQPY